MDMNEPGLRAPAQEERSFLRAVSQARLLAFSDGCKALFGIVPAANAFLRPIRLSIITAAQSFRLSFFFGARR
jgi:hypothetical protein